MNGRYIKLELRFGGEKQELTDSVNFHTQAGPKLHLHAGIGRADEAIVGCPRGGATVFCVLEAVIMEIEGVDASRRIDPEMGIKLLMLGGKPA